MMVMSVGLVLVVLAKPASRGDVLQLLMWGGIGIFAICVLFIALLVVRQKLLSPGDKGGDGRAGFSFEDLDRMHQSGRISLEEYRTLRRQATELYAPADKE